MNKNILKAILPLLIAAALCSGCATFERKAYVATGAMVAAVDAGMTVYGEMVRAGQVSPERQEQVKKLFEKYQYALRLERTAVRYYRKYKDNVLLVEAMAMLTETSQNLITELKGTNVPRNSDSTRAPGN